MTYKRLYDLVMIREVHNRSERDHHGCVMSTAVSCEHVAGGNMLGNDSCHDWGPTHNSSGMGTGITGTTGSIPWLMMPWLLASPGHQKPWYWPYLGWGVLVVHKEGCQVPIHLNLLRPRQNSRRFAADIFNCIFLNENVCISINISIKFVPKVRINYIPALVRIMPWHRPGDNLLSEPITVSLLMHICVTRTQWVYMTKELFNLSVGNIQKY